MKKRDFLASASDISNVPNKRPYRGVIRRPSDRYGAEIGDRQGHQRNKRWLGTFNTTEEAARAYDTAARARYGRQACTNFPSLSAMPHSDTPAFDLAWLVMTAMHNDGSSLLIPVSSTPNDGSSASGTAVPWFFPTEPSELAGLLQDIIEPFFPRNNSNKA